MPPTQKKRCMVTCANWLGQRRRRGSEDLGLELRVDGAGEAVAPVTGCRRTALTWRARRHPRRFIRVNGRTWRRHCGRRNSAEP